MDRSIEQQGIWQSSFNFTHGGAADDPPTDWWTIGLVDRQSEFWC